MYIFRTKKPPFTVDLTTPNGHLDHFVSVGLSESFEGADKKLDLVNPNIVQSRSAYDGKGPKTTERKALFVQGLRTADAGSDPEGSRAP